MSAMLADRIADSLIGGMSEARLEWHLTNWADWMHSDVVTEGYPEHSPVFISGGASATVEELLAPIDLRCAMAVDALLPSLSPGERSAIAHTYIYAVFRFPRNNLPELLEAARTRIARGLVSRSIY